MPTLHRTIVRPLITEKTSVAYQDRGEYLFEVHPDANKTEIRSAIEQLFGVKVTGVWTSNQRGKNKRMGNERRPQAALEEGDREAPRRRHDRDLRGLTGAHRPWEFVNSSRSPRAARFRSVSDFAEITTTTPEKSLLEPIKKSGWP